MDDNYEYNNLLTKFKNLDETNNPQSGSNKSTPTPASNEEKPVSIGVTEPVATAEEEAKEDAANTNTQVCLCLFVFIVVDCYYFKTRKQNSSHHKKHTKT